MSFKATLARFVVGVLGNDGGLLMNVVSYKENYWFILGVVIVSSGMYGFIGGEMISVGVSDSDGDWVNIGCFVGTTRVSAWLVFMFMVMCVVFVCVEDDIVNVLIMVGVWYVE